MPELFDQHLAQVFGGRPRFAASRHTFHRHGDAFVIVDNRSLRCRLVEYWAERSAHFFQKGAQKKRLSMYSSSTRVGFDDVFEFSQRFCAAVTVGSILDQLRSTALSLV